MLAEEDEGRLYPVTRRAESVRDVFLNACDRLQVDLMCGVELVRASYADCWELTLNAPSAPLSFKPGRDAKARIRNARKALAAAPRAERTIRARRVVIATGGQSDAICEIFGIPPPSGAARALPPSPADSRPKARAKPTPPRWPSEHLDGLRVEGMLSLMRNGAAIAFEHGEVLFRTYGISGIAALNLSRRLQPGDIIDLDLFPPSERGAAARPVAAARARSRKLRRERPVARRLGGAPLAALVCHLANGSNDPLARCAAVLHRLPLRVLGTAEHRQAHVHRGGIPLSAIDLDRFAVTRRRDGSPVRDLHACGEAVDMDADCGDTTSPGRGSRHAGRRVRSERSIMLEISEISCSLTEGASERGCIAACTRETTRLLGCRRQDLSRVALHRKSIDARKKIKRALHPQRAHRCRLGHRRAATPRTRPSPRRAARSGRRRRRALIRASPQRRHRARRRRAPHRGGCGMRGALCRPHPRRGGPCAPSHRAGGRRDQAHERRAPFQRHRRARSCVQHPIPGWAGPARSPTASSTRAPKIPCIASSCARWWRRARRATSSGTPSRTSARTSCPRSSPTSSPAFARAAERCAFARRSPTSSSMRAAPSAASPWLTRGLAEHIPARAVILACGHSARDVFALLKHRGVALERKTFAMGVRIEHLQADIDRALYGTAAGHPALGAAPYSLVAHLDNGRSLFSFCMCPGGEVVAAASERGGSSQTARASMRAMGATPTPRFWSTSRPAICPAPTPLPASSFSERASDAPLRAAAVRIARRRSSSAISCRDGQARARAASPPRTRAASPGAASMRSCPRTSSTPCVRGCRSWAQAQGLRLPRCRAHGARNALELTGHRRPRPHVLRLRQHARSLPLRRGSGIRGRHHERRHRRHPLRPRAHRRTARLRERGAHSTSPQEERRPGTRPRRRSPYRATR